MWTQKQMQRQSSLSERQFTWPMRQFVKDSEFVVKYKYLVTEMRGGK